jgi:glycosyltransferase involved in cell wall biosynthesis
MSSRLVSVIVPTYNRALDCRKAVESVLRQTHPEVEALVVDDGSKDDTRDAVAKLDPRVRYVFQENAGVVAARNRGLAEARGDFVAFLDSDDQFLPWKLEAQLAVLDAHPRAGMVWTDMTAVDPEGRELERRHLATMYHAYRQFDRAARLAAGKSLAEMWPTCPPDLAASRSFEADLGAQMFLGNLVHTSTVLLRRERQAAVGLFDAGLPKSGEDYDYHYRTCRKGPVAYLDVASVLYRVGAADQLTADRYLAFMARNTLRTVSRALEESGGRVALPADQVRARMAAVHLRVGRAELDGDPRVARRHLLASLRWKPAAAAPYALILASILPRGVREALRRLKRGAR